MYNKQKKFVCAKQTLQKQLQDLSSDVIPAAVEKPRVRKQNPAESMDIDIDSYATLATGDDDVHVELDEKDFSDPHLLVR
jgi:hypothetical protein